MGLKFSSYAQVARTGLNLLPAPLAASTSAPPSPIRRDWANVVKGISTKGVPVSSSEGACSEPDLVPDSPSTLPTDECPSECDDANECAGGSLAREAGPPADGAPRDPDLSQGNGDEQYFVVLHCAPKREELTDYPGAQVYQLPLGLLQQHDPNVGIPRSLVEDLKQGKKTRLCHFIYLTRRQTAIDFSNNLYHSRSAEVIATRSEGEGKPATAVLNEGTVFRPSRCISHLPGTLCRKCHFHGHHERECDDIFDCACCRKTWRSRVRPSREERASSAQ